MPDTPLPRPIAISDSQLDAILRAAAPLQPIERSAFLSALAHRLRHELEPPGDGALFRLIKETIRSIGWRPPRAEARHDTRHLGPPIA